MAETASQTPASSPDKKLISRVAAAMFRKEMRGSAEKKSAADRKAVWEQQKSEYKKEARKLHRMLDREGVELVLKKDA